MDYKDDQLWMIDYIDRWSIIRMINYGWSISLLSVDYHSPSWDSLSERDTDTPDMVMDQNRWSKLGCLKMRVIPPFFWWNMMRIQGRGTLIFRAWALEHPHQPATKRVGSPAESSDDFFGCSHEFPAMFLWFSGEKKWWKMPSVFTPSDTFSGRFS